LNHTAEWRSKEERKNHFLSLNKHPVTPATFAHWLKQVLKEAGVSEDFQPIQQEQQKYQ